MQEVLLIDHGSVYWAAYHSSVNESVSAGHDRCVEHVRKLANGAKAVAICCDSPRSTRREQHPSYKATRPLKDHAAIEELKRTKETLARDGFLIWEHEGYEADDVIASAVRAMPEDCVATVCSADKDLLQLVHDGRCKVISIKTGAVLTAEDVRAKLGVYPAKVRDWLALVGDKSDNVTGVPGIGAVKAAALLNEFGTIETLLEKLQTNATHELFKPALSAALRDPANLANIATAQHLVTLIDTLPVPFDEIFEERVVQPLTATLAGEFEDDEADSAPVAAPAPAPAPPATDTALAVSPPQPAPRVLASQPVSGREVATAQPSGPMTYEQQLQPGSLKAAFLLAEHLYNSRLYSRFPSKEAIFAVIIRGREMGLTALTALDSFHIVEGKPSPGAHLLITRAKMHPDCEYFRFVSGDNTYAEYETKSRQSPKPTTLRYTIEDAKRAGVVKSGSNWEKRPAEMLRKTSAVQLARIEYPEALGGLYSHEELVA
jgi:5'-3' exonuclease